MFNFFVDNSNSKHSIENAQILPNSILKTPSISSNGSVYENQNIELLKKKPLRQLSQSTSTFAFVPLQSTINTINTRQSLIFQNNIHQALPVTSETTQKLRYNNNKKESMYSLLSNNNFASRYSRTIGAAKLLSSKKSKRLVDLSKVHQNEKIKPKNR